MVTPSMERRLAGLFDEPKPHGPRRTGDMEIKDLLIRTLQDATHRSASSMAKTLGALPDDGFAVLRAFRLPPRRSESFQLARDSLFVEKVGLSLDPLDRALVLCVDESQIQAPSTVHCRRFR